MIVPPADGLATHETLVGRERELALAGTLLDGLPGASRPRLVLSGELGTGKSSMLGALRAFAVERRLHVLEGAAAELTRDRPLGLALDVFGDELGLLADRQLAEALGRIATQNGGLLILCDDLQWADQPSLALVSHLLRRPPPGTMLVVAHRTGGMPDRLVRALGHASTSDAIHHIVLGPLGERAVEMLLVGLPGPAALKVRASSGGNPFYLSQLAAAARTGPGLPATLKAVVAGELSRLSPSARDLAKAAALLGPTFDATLAQDIAGLDDTQGGTALRELETWQLIRDTEALGWRAFRQPVLAEIVRTWAGEAWCTAAHARTAVLLAERDAPIASRAHHVVRSARPGDNEAAELLRAAGAEVGDRDPVAAASWFAAALRLLGSSSAAAERLPLLLDHAAALTGAGELGVARAPLAEARDLLPRVGHVQRARTLVPLARVEALVGHQVERLRHLEREDGGVALQSAVAVLQWCAGDWAAMAATARGARDNLAEDGDVVLRSRVMALLSIAERQLGHTSAARTALAQAEWGVNSGVGASGCLETLTYLAQACDALERFEACLRYAEQLRDVAEARGQQFFVSVAHATRSAALLSLGQVDEAQRASVDALAANQGVSNALGAVWAHAHSCRIAVALGDLTLASHHREQTLLAHAEVLTAADVSVALMMAAESRVAFGEVDAGIADLLEAGGGPALDSIRPTDRAQYAALIAEAEQSRGDTAAASRWSERAMQMAAAAGSASAHGWAWRAGSVVLLAEGRPAGAASAAANSAESFGSVDRKIEAAKARALGGTALAQAGDTAAGVAMLRSAHEALTAAGAVRERELAAGQLRRLGRRVRGSAKGAARPIRGVGALSPRERQITELIGRGATNREAAAELVLSEKTVESHLTKIYAKLGVTTRTAAAHALLLDRGTGEQDL